MSENDDDVCSSSARSFVTIDFDLAKRAREASSEIGEDFSQFINIAIAQRLCSKQVKKARDYFLLSKHR